MTQRFLIAILIALATALPAPSFAADSEQAEQRDPKSAKEAELYQKGTAALDAQKWEKAVDAFQQVAQMGGAKADAALYWVAYGLHKQGRKGEALTTLRAFWEKYPKSRWKKEARALEMEIRPGRGHAGNPDAESDEELKLIAINSLMHTEPEKALPLLEKILNGSGSEDLKERALFVLAQNSSPRARQIIANVARGNAHPDLQEKAIHYLGVFRGKENRQLLEEIYRSTTNLEVKEKILHAFMVAGDRERLLTAARSEKHPELRGDAAHQLGVMGARVELWELYRTESDPDVKEEILQGMFIAGDAEHILELARVEKNGDLREEAVQKLGLFGRERTGGTLVSMYRAEQDPEIKEAVIQALFVQNNATALIDIAKTEKDRELRQEAVQKLSVMHNKEARDYLLQLLND
jgi:HEAT repeat protein